jgi:hypothetical protein
MIYIHLNLTYDMRCQIALGFEYEELEQQKVSALNLKKVHYIRHMQIFL